MTKVITYGTYDLFHYGHRRLLERAKVLGDYLIVGVTADDFDKTRGKIDVCQSLMERIEGVRNSGLADEIVVEEYEGQKIDDIKRYGVDIFTVGSDWTGKFDYLSDYCQVIYLPRTEGISSSEVRAKNRSLHLGIVSVPNSTFARKFIHECGNVNGVEIAGIWPGNTEADVSGCTEFLAKDFDQLLDRCDALYIASQPEQHSKHTEYALQAGKHVLCESPIAMNPMDCTRCFSIAKERHLVLMEAIKTAYSTAYNRLLLLAKSGRIGKIVCVDATCTSLAQTFGKKLENEWSSLASWGPMAMLPAFQLLGTDYRDISITTCLLEPSHHIDIFSKIDLTYPNAAATLKVGRGVKSEGELILSGTAGYIYVPAPWWKTDYFEIRYENPANNQRYFYPLEGEGIRYEIVNFIRAIETGAQDRYIDPEVSKAIAGVMNRFEQGENVKRIEL